MALYLHRRRWSPVRVKAQGQVKELEMNLETLSNEELKDLLETKKWDLEVESAKTWSFLSEERPYQAIMEHKYTDLCDELIDDISWIEDEILTRECESMLR